MTACLLLPFPIVRVFIAKLVCARNAAQRTSCSACEQFIVIRTSFLTQIGASAELSRRFMQKHHSLIVVGIGITAPPMG
jgi:hypothetical protein